MPPFNFEAEARNLAMNLDRGHGDDVARRLQEDSHYLDPRGYSALLKRVAQYDQKGVGDDLTLVDNRNGTLEAFIQRHPVDVGMIVPDAPPPPPAAYYPGEVPPPPPPRPNTAGCQIASVGVGAVLGNLIAGRGNRGIGTAAGAVGGAIVGSDACNR
jgi:hypothetical protein